MTEGTKDVRDLKMLLHKNLMDEINDSNKYIDMYKESILEDCGDEDYKKGLLELAYEEYTHAKFFDMMLKKYGFLTEEKEYSELKMRILMYC